MRQNLIGDMNELVQMEGCGWIWRYGDIDYAVLEYGVWSMEYGPLEYFTFTYTMMIGGHFSSSEFTKNFQSFSASTTRKIFSKLSE